MFFNFSDQLLAVIKREKRPLDFEMLMRLILGVSNQGMFETWQCIFYEIKHYSAL